MADPKSKKADEPVAGPQVEGGADAGVSERTAGYKDNPDKPDPSSIAQVEELQSAGPNEES